VQVDVERKPVVMARLCEVLERTRKSLIFTCGGGVLGRSRAGRQRRPHVDDHEVGNGGCGLITVI
jgi:hypothetical protein